MWLLMLIAAVSFIASLIFIPFCIKSAYILNILDHPDGKLKTHSVTTPYLGGVALFLATFFPIFFLNHLFLFPSIFFGCCGLLIVGIIDDKYHIKPLHKMFGIAVVSIYFIFVGYKIDAGYLSYFLTFMWFSSVINAFNLVDIMDGLASTLALCVVSGFAYLAYATDNQFLLMLCFSLIGSLCGFMLFNKPPARIYLGDAGALYLGGIVALLPFFLNKNSFLTLSLYPYFLTALIICAIPLTEIFFLIIIRTYKGRAFYHGGPDHFVSYLRKKKWSVEGILLFVAILSIALLFVAFGMFFCFFSKIATLTLATVLLFFSVKLIYF